uniref:Uncharacterized protein n=1 Tax=Steinernema glaseri TaxID=37863 RepID=A0A1I7ZWE1_9BILA
MVTGMVTERLLRTRSDLVSDVESPEKNHGSLHRLCFRAMFFQIRSSVLGKGPLSKVTSPKRVINKTRANLRKNGRTSRILNCEAASSPTNWIKRQKLKSDASPSDQNRRDARRRR